MNRRYVGLVATALLASPCMPIASARSAHPARTAAATNPIRVDVVPASAADEYAPPGFHATHALAVTGSKVNFLTASSHRFAFYSRKFGSDHRTRLVVVSSRTGAMKVISPRGPKAQIWDYVVARHRVAWRELTRSRVASCPFEQDPGDCYTWAIFERNLKTGRTRELDHSTAPVSQFLSPMLKTRGRWLAWQSASNTSHGVVRAMKWGAKRPQDLCAVKPPVEVVVGRSNVFAAFAGSQADTKSVWKCALTKRTVSKSTWPNGAREVVISERGRVAWVTATSPSPHSPFGQLRVHLPPPGSQTFTVSDLYNLFWVDDFTLVSDEPSGTWSVTTTTGVPRKAPVTYDFDATVQCDRNGVLTFGVDRPHGTLIVSASPRT